MSSLDVNLDQIAAKALALRPLRVLGWVVAAPFIVLGVLLYLAWLAPAFLISSGYEGWKASEKSVKRWRAQAREAESRGG